MKKILSLSLLFAALVFQSCNKLSSNIDEDLVPIVFSQAGITTQAGITKAGGGILELGENDKIEALVLGSQVLNDWSTIYASSSENSVGGTISSAKEFANGTIIFQGVAVEGSTPTSTSTYNRVVYPLKSAAKQDIYIKALAPYQAINSSSISNDPETATNNIVTFNITGKHDIMVTKATKKKTDTPSQGYGNRTGDPIINLVFERLLAKINFKIKTPTSTSQKAWGTLTNITVTGGHTKLIYNLTTHLLVPPETFKPDGIFISTPDDLKLTIPIPPDDAADAYSIMVYPQSNIYKIKVTTSEGLTATKDLDLILQKGMQSNITITLSDAKTMTFEVHITNWEPADDIGVDI